MPVIAVRSLPLPGVADLRLLVEAISTDFAREARVEPEHVTVTWQLLPAGAYAVGGRAAETQPAESHPVLVDLLLPDFHDPGAVERMLRAIAQAVAIHARLPIANVFVCARLARPGFVFESGRTVRWSSPDEAA
jgi:phenylpyruvate tautomerase PptA (4-oxalocrotonate tautomerase family)